MKTKNLLLFVFVCCASVAVAQLQVTSGGNVEIGTPSGELYTSASIKGSKTYGLKVSSSGGTGTRYGIHITSTSPCVSSPAAIGLHSEITSSPGCGGKVVGVRGYIVSNQSSGYGVSGLMGGNSSGAGIYGSISSVENTFSGIYAGYFNGNSTVNNGTLAATVVPLSDSRLKEGMRAIDAKQTTKNLLKLKPIEYYLKQIDIPMDSINEKGEKISYTVKRYDENTEFFQKKRYGLIAQDLQKVYPDLVYTAGDGYLGIDYTGLIPLLLQMLQEQQAEIGQLQQQLLPANRNALPAFSENTNEAVPESELAAVLYQNTPNPFNQSTEIGYYIPKTVRSANIYIYDINGVQQRNISISEREKGAVVLQASALRAGIYFYTLICDGKPIDSKQMILTR